MALAVKLSAVTHFCDIVKQEAFLINCDIEYPTLENNFPYVRVSPILVCASVRPSVTFLTLISVRLSVRHVFDPFSVRPFVRLSRFRPFFCASVRPYNQSELGKNTPCQPPGRKRK